MYVFDLLVLDEQEILAAPYAERRELLEDLRLRGDGIDPPPFFVDAADDLYAAVQVIIREIGERKDRRIVASRVAASARQ